MDTKATFDNEAKEYDFNSRAVNIYFDEALDTLVKNIKVNAHNPTILDICCGTGILTEKAALRFPNAKFIGVDFSVGMLNIAKSRMSKYDFTYNVFDICDEERMNTLPQVDLVISSFGIHNIHGEYNKQKAINNIIKHLKPNCQFITCDILKGVSQDEQFKFDKFQMDYLLKTYSQAEADDWMNLLKEEDDPETWETNVQLLENAGCDNINKIWQKEFLCIWQGTKK